jgi:hypothetical protein
MKAVLILALTAFISAAADGAFGQSAISITSEDASALRKSTQANSSTWRRAAVDPSTEHLALFYGSPDEDVDCWSPVARIGRPVDGVFPVEFIGEPDTARTEELAAAQQQLDYYLVDLGASDPWAYAVYHATTLANLYSRVHWVVVQPDN